MGWSRPSLVLHRTASTPGFIYRIRRCAITALNSGVTDKYKLFIVVESIEDAHRLAVSCRNIREINLGGLKPREEAVKKLYKTIPVSAQDEVLLRELIEAGTRIEIRQVPGDAKIEVKEII